MTWNDLPALDDTWRLTDLVKQGFSEMELRIIAGWEKNSAMPEVYVHLSGGDIERKMLERPAS